MKINASKHKDTFAQQAHLNSSTPPPAGKWQAVIRAVGERRQAGSGTVTALHLALGNPLSVEDQHAKRAEALAGKARVRVDLWHPSGPDDATNEQRWAWLAMAVGVEELDLDAGDEALAAALTGKPFLAEFIHRQRKGSTYTDTVLVQVGACAQDVAARVKALCADQLRGDKILRQRPKAQQVAHEDGEDPFGPFSTGGVE